MSAWIARDEDGTLVIFSEKSSSRYGAWFCSYNANCMFLNNKDYPEVTYENSPVELKTNIT